MDILVLLAEADDTLDVAGVDGTAPLPIARVRSAAGQAGSHVGFGRSTREVVTLYGPAEPDRLAVAIAAAFEGRCPAESPRDAVRSLGVWPDRGAVGDVAWRDRVTGQLVTQGVAVPAAAIAGMAGRLLVEHGRAIRETVAGLASPDWPEGTSRAIHLCLTVFDPPHATAGADGDALLASLREADGYDDGD